MVTLGQVKQRIIYIAKLSRKIHSRLNSYFLVKEAQLELIYEILNRERDRMLFTF